MILNTLILRKILQTTLSITLIFCGLLLLAQSLRFIDYVLNRGAPMGLFLQLMLSMLPRFLMTVLPIALMTATLLTYLKARQNKEIVIIQAAGRSVGQLVKPAAWAAGIVAVLVMFLATYGLPASQTVFRDLQYKLRSGYAISLLQDGEFNNINNDISVYVAKRTADGTLENLVIFDGRNREAPVTITAKTGQLAIIDNAPRIAIRNGGRQQLNRETGQFSKLSFDSYVLDLGALMPIKRSRKESDQEKGLQELLYSHDQSLKAVGHSRLANVLLTLLLPIMAGFIMLNSPYSRNNYLKPAIVISFLTGGLWGILLFGTQLTVQSMGLGLLVLYLCPVLITIVAIALSYRPIRLSQKFS